jgi:hypothetical protein
VRRPWFYSSLKGLLLFQVMRGGIESLWIFGRSRGPFTPRILTLDPIRSEYTDDEPLSRSCAGKTFRNGYVIQFSFLGSNVSPSFQILNAIAAILRASVSRAISLRIPFFSRP